MVTRTRFFLIGALCLLLVANAAAGEQDSSTRSQKAGACTHDAARESAACRSCTRARDIAAIERLKARQSVGKSSLQPIRIQYQCSQSTTCHYQEVLDVGALADFSFEALGVALGLVPGCSACAAIARGLTVLDLVNHLTTAHQRATSLDDVRTIVGVGTELIKEEWPRLSTTVSLLNLAAHPGLLEAFKKERLIKITIKTRHVMSEKDRAAFREWSRAHRVGGS